MIAKLAAAGAEFAVIPAVTPHICIAELLKLSPLPLVNLVEELQREVEARGLRRVALFGTRYTVESGLFGMLRGVSVAALRTGGIDFVHETYMNVANTGAGSEAQRARAHRRSGGSGDSLRWSVGTEARSTLSNTRRDSGTDRRDRLSGKERHSY